MNKRPLWLVILINCLIWVLVYLIPYALAEQRWKIHNYIIWIGAGATVNISLYYFNYFILVPRLLFTKKYIAYALLMPVIIILCTMLIDLYFYFVVSELQHWRHKPSPVFSRALWWNLYPLLTSVAAGISVRVAREWAKNERARKEMQAEQLSSELAFLKSQVNPHFLFNTLNNICSLARKKSDDTEPAIIKLSQIMRYMLTDSRQEKVGLDEEIDYLNNFIELQKLRIGEKVDIGFEIVGEVSGISIEPLLLIPFVENAFKHGVSYSESSRIHISLSSRNNELEFIVENSLPSNKNAANLEESGIGLKNVKRRLELLYPGRHELEIRDTQSAYIVKLKLHFK